MVSVDLHPKDEVIHQALCAIYFESWEYKQLIESEYHGPIFNHDIYDWGGFHGLITLQEFMRLIRYEQFVCSPERS